MLTIHLLGGASIETDGRPLTGPASQRHRLALLALLATAHPGGMTRDKLIAYLWPERDTHHARNVLSQAIHILRRALGEQAVLSAGEEIRLDPRAAAVDVVEFREALESGGLERAVGLYRGPFLDGFFLSGSREFERHVDGERARLREGYRDALADLARQAAAAGDHPRAVHWWRRLGAEDPYSSRVTLELMKALEAAGERAEAIRQSRDHALLLEQELGAEPDPDVVALAERMRTYPAGNAEAPPEPAPDATQPPRGPRRRTAFGALRETTDLKRSWRSPLTAGVLVLLAVLLAGSGVSLWTRPGDPGSGAAPRPSASGSADLLASTDDGAPSIAVLAFDDLSPEGDQGWFADGISEEILSALAGVDGLRVAARQSSFAFRGSPADVRRIGEALGVGAVLEGSVRRGGDSVWVTTQLIDARTGFHQWSETYARLLTAENLRMIQSEIAEEVVAALELPDGGRRGWGLGNPTDSAYGLYLEGRSLLRRVQVEFGEEELLRREEVLRSIGRLREVVAESPDWAPGWAALGEALHWAASGGIDPATHYSESVVALERALELDPEHSAAHASRAFVLQSWELDLEAAEARYRRALTLGGQEAWGGYGMLLLSIGRHDEAVDALRYAEAHDPLSLYVKIRLARAYVCAERFEEAIAYAERGLALGRGPWSLWSLALALERSGRVDEALARIEEASGQGALAPGWDLARALLHARSGREDEARTLLPGLGDGPRGGAIQMHAAALVALDEPDAAFAVLEGLADGAPRSFVFDCRYPELRSLEEDPRYRALLARLDSSGP